MKKTIIIASAVLALIALLIALPSVTNSIILSSLADDFADEISKSGAEVAESEKIYGKLNGNGNGINFFGAVLVKKDSVADIEALMDELGEDFEAVEYYEPSGAAVASKHLEHGNLEFDTDISGGEYLVICFYESSHPMANKFDIKGH